jgi:hypothetical protein
LEARFSRASELLDDVARLLGEIAEMEGDAKEYATRALGPALGGTAFDLALASFPALASRAGTPTSIPVVPVHHSNRSAEATVRSSAAAPIRDLVEGHVTFYGERILASQSGEAKVIADKVIEHRRTGGTKLLYPVERGKNHWRKRVEKAVLKSLETPATPPAAAAALPRPAESAEQQHAVPTNPIVAVLIPEAAAVVETPPPALPDRGAMTWEVDPLDDDPLDDHVPARAVRTAPAIPEDVVAPLIVNETPTVESPAPTASPPEAPAEVVTELQAAVPAAGSEPVRPETPSLGRRPSYGNSNPKPEGLAEAIESMRENGRDPTVPAPAPVRRSFSRPNFTKRSAT